MTITEIRPVGIYFRSKILDFIYKKAGKPRGSPASSSMIAQ